ncbi:hypothetical protein EC957_002614 [Mortierella hygrophila]|uniref:Endoplasmic reticulum junction formation protein lunapark n=1 Tax=Mortierella hygrophila TaxID=979708 RepID=A0A9P6K1I9_9FUNG|nr:hypothetical protein EC957_002614 [Mortierella hygrophila]
MGGIISRLRQSNDSDYEKILSDLDSNIRKAEMRLSVVNLREKRMMGLWLIYSVLSWIGYTAVFGLYLHQQYYDDPQKWALAFAVVVLGIPVIYSGRSVISVWYKRSKTTEESQLSILRADQRLKVEELKKKTAYYSTKTLLERYDPSSQQQRSNGARPSGPDGRPNSAQQNGQPRPQQPNMLDPGLRQRQGQGVMNGPMNPALQGRPMGVSSGMQPQPHHMGQGPQGHPNGPRAPQQTPFGPGHPNHAMSPPYGYPNNERHWYDKIVDVIVGEEGPDTKYALICGQCFAHNGLALPQEIEDIQYVCPKCNFLNPSRRRTRLAAAGIGSSPNPDSTFLRAVEKPLPFSREPSPAPSMDRSPRSDDQHQHNQHQHHHHNGPGLSEGTSPEPVSDHVPTGERSSESDDIEFVNNWHDSDAEGVHHDEESEDEDRDGAQGYVVSSKDVVESKPAKSASKTKTGGKKKSNHA